MRRFGHMDHEATIGDYYRRFFRRLSEDATPWARDNIGFGIAMLTVPPLLVYLRDRSHPIDWQVIRTALYLYSAVFSMYLIFYAVRTAWKLDIVRVEEMEAANSRIEQLLEKPNLHADVLELSSSILDFIYERMRNAPQRPIRRFGLRDPGAILQEMNEHALFNAAAQAYEADTLGIHEYRFVRKVMAAVNELRQIGLQGEAMDRDWGNPGSNEGIKEAGKRLALLADQMVDENRQSDTKS